MGHILIIYATQCGHVAQMAEQVCAGVAMGGMEAKLRTVPNISATCEASAPEIPSSGPLYATPEDLEHCSGIILGSPIHFGNMSAELKYFLDQTVSQWTSGALINKPAGVFAAGGSMHGGQESTLLSMMLPLFHHGAILMGIPYSEPGLNQTTRGGTPYGPSYVVGYTADDSMTNHETLLCQALGKRVALLSKKIA